jgi:hypothetical protein
VILLSSPGGSSESSQAAPAMEDRAPVEDAKPRKTKAKAEEEISIDDIPF